MMPGSFSGISESGHGIAHLAKFKEGHPLNNRKPNAGSLIDRLASGAVNENRNVRYLS
jgi:hypothetical protein